MKTFRLIALLVLAALATACAQLPTATSAADDSQPAKDTGQGQLGGGTRQ